MSILFIYKDVRNLITSQYYIINYYVKKKYQIKFLEICFNFGIYFFNKILLVWPSNIKYVCGCQNDMLDRKFRD